jgi:prepilin-type N-terminal cleavage/methylation domain-containing protein
MKLLRKEKGFTLIELLLVVVIIGLMLAVIVPRAWRANIDTKYGLVRQNCAELASFGQEWAETQINAQPDTLNCPLIAYYFTLAGSTGGASTAQTWVANTAFNWTGSFPAKALAPVIPGGWGGYASRPTAPECSVSNTVPPEKIPRNPFNGANYFVSANNPTAAGAVIPGAIACAVNFEAGTGWHYFAFLYQGTDSTTTGTGLTTSYYAGQDITLAGLRNGVFFARTR